MFVKKSVIKKFVNDMGFRASKEFHQALDEIVEIQIRRALELAKKNRKKVLKKNGVLSLFV